MSILAAAMHINDLKMGFIEQSWISFKSFTLLNNFACRKQQDVTKIQNQNEFRPSGPKRSAVGFPGTATEHSISTNTKVTFKLTLTTKSKSLETMEWRHRRLSILFQTVTCRHHLHKTHSTSILVYKQKTARCAAAAKSWITKVTSSLCWSALNEESSFDTSC